MPGKLTELLSNLKEQETLDYVRNALDEKVSPMDLMEEAKEGMAIVGERFSNKEYFVPDLVFSGEILKQVVALLEPHLGKSRSEDRLATIVLGTVAGDIHDIGKDLVGFMLDINGFEVIDLGIDVPVENFVGAVKEHKPKIVALSGFLTLAFESMKQTIEAIRAEGFNEVKFMIGGGQMDDQVRDFTGADAYGTDAMEAVELAKQWV